MAFAGRAATAKIAAALGLGAGSGALLTQRRDSALPADRVSGRFL